MRSPMAALLAVLVLGVGAWLMFRVEVSVNPDLPGAETETDRAAEGAPTLEGSALSGAASAGMNDAGTAGTQPTAAASPPREATARPTGTVSGRVTTSRGQPVKTGLVLVQQQRLADRWYTESDENGMFTFEHVSPCRAYVAVWDAEKKTRYEALNELREVPASGLELEFDEPPTIRLVGRVLDPQGSPLPGGSVLVVAADGRSAEGTIQDGLLEIDVVGRPLWLALGYYVDRHGDPLPYLPWRKDVGDPTAALAIQLEAPNILAGKVVDREGKGIHGAQVRTLTGGKDRTDASGAFTLEDLPFRRLRLEVLPPKGFATPPVRTVPPGARGITFVLEPASSIKGRVLVPEGTTLWGARIDARWVAADGRAQGTRGEWLESNTFRIDALPRDTLVSIRLDVHEDPTSERPLAPAFIENVPSGTQDLEVPLAEGAVLEGRLVDAEGRPSAKTTIWLRLDGHGYSTTTNAQGAFRVGGLPLGGKGTLTIPDKTGAVRLEHSLELPTSPLTLQLAAVAPVEGVVVGRVSGARWYLAAVETGSEEPRILAGVVLDGPTDRFTIPDVPKKRPFRIVARALGGEVNAYGESEMMSADGSIARVVIQDGFTLTGSARYKGQPLRDAGIIATNTTHRAQTTTDGHGTFTLSGLPPGKYTLTILDHHQLGATGRVENVAAGSTGIVIGK